MNTRLHKLSTANHAAKICIFNVKYSPNLGDGLLAECLEAGLVHHGINHTEISTFDLAARTEYAAGKASRAPVLNALFYLPGSMRQLLLKPPLAWFSRKVWIPHYQEALKDASAVVIGGGNLFTDMDLNFPTKLAALLDVASDRNLPVMIFGVGVAQNWSSAGLRIVRQSLLNANVVRVSVRDLPSLQNFETLFGDVISCVPNIVRDPGLAASRLKTANPAKDSNQRIGICVTAALAIRYHSDVALSDSFLLNWYSELISELVSDKRQVLLFTNGSPEDVEFADRVFAANSPKVNVELVSRPKDPDDLIKIVAGCSGIVAFRMHAIIASISFRLGVIALRWDSKLDAFMESVDLEQFLISAEGSNARCIVSALNNSISQIQRNEPIEAMIDDALKNIGDLAAALTKEIENEGCTLVGPTPCQHSISTAKEFSILTRSS